MVTRLLGCVSVLAGSQAASAQAVSQTADQPVSYQQEDQGGISDIVVTALRREESVQKTALSIQALSSEDLARANLTKPEDLNAIAQGVAVGTGGNAPQVYIRGIGNFGTNSLAEGAVAFNLDGVYIARAYHARHVL